MSRPPIRPLFLVLAAMALLVAPDPAPGASLFVGKKDQNTEQNQIYVKPQTSPERTWREYFFGRKENKEGSGQPIYNSSKPRRGKELSLLDFEPRTPTEILQQGLAYRSPQQDEIMRKFKNEQHKRLAQMFIARDKGSKNPANAIQQAQDVAPPAAEEKEEKKVIYNKPGLEKPSKVFTDYR